jgi:hypothetical protein
MTTTDSLFQRALSNMLTEIFDGPPGQEAYLLNRGDPGLLRQLDTIDASTASKRPMPGKTIPTVPSSADQDEYGFVAGKQCRVIEGVQGMSAAAE